MNCELRGVPCGTLLILLAVVCATLGELRAHLREADDKFVNWTWSAMHRNTDLLWKGRKD